jgi:hypothetical protein
MRFSASLTRKLIYSMGILLLFGIMVPYTQWLEVRQKEQELGEATIGQVDAGSFLLKLALLGGFRGMAVNILWTRAIDLQKVHDWDRMKSTIDMITKLQPHFLAVWTYQSWNLAYNVSVEWDAPEDKYDWIKKGIQFVQEGVKKNRRSPDLVWDTAWYYHHKLGFSDEAVIIRRLYHDDKDDEFKSNEEGIVRNDNFQLAHDWFKRAVDLVDSGEAGARPATSMETPIEYVDAPVQHKGRPGDLHFRTMPAHSYTRYAAALEKESMKGIPATFGARARDAWDNALSAWLDFGLYEFPCHNNDKEKVRIDDYDNPDRYKTLSKNQQYWIGRWGDQTQYMYWKDRCKAEREPQGVEARRLFYEGTKAIKAANFPEAAQKYKQGLDIWDKLLARHPTYEGDFLNKRDTGLIVKRYVRALKNAGLEVPEKMPFKDLLKVVEKDNTVDPYDALEMMPASSESAQQAPPGSPGG